MKYRKIKIGKQYKNRTNLMLFLLFTCFTLCLSVGYAALNRELKISGEASFRVDADIRITSNGTIYVKDDTSKTFVNKLNSDVNCVIKNA